MKKYIEVEKLKTEIERLAKTYQDSIWRTVKGDTAKDFRDKLLSIINSLLQEHPEVDLEKEIDRMWNPRFNLGWDDNSLLSINHKSFEAIARHFYELGLNARKGGK